VPRPRWGLLGMLAVGLVFGFIRDRRHPNERFDPGG
jgi:hypothetical protein